MSKYQGGLPRFANPPGSYDPRYFADLIRAFDQLRVVLLNNGPLTAEQLTITNIPDSDSGLPPGAIYRVGNQLYISVIDVAALSGQQIDFSVGSLTVDIT